MSSEDECGAMTSFGLISCENVLIFQTLFVAKPHRRPRQDTSTAADLITPRCGTNICDLPTGIFIYSKRKSWVRVHKRILFILTGWALL